MQDNKKYYWLKMKFDFFRRHDIRIVESMPNGKDYVLFYLKLLFESARHEGFLRFSDTIPYNEEMLSAVTNTNIDIIRSAIKIFQELNMMEILDDGTIFMTECEKLLGYESEWAEKKREYRKRIADIERTKEDNARTKKDNVRQEIEIEKEIEIEIEIDNKADNVRKEDIEAVKNRWNSTSLPKVSSIRPGTQRYRSLHARIKESGIDDVISAIDNASKSSFLSGKNNRGWVATFDWFLKPNNFVKVLEGNYTDNEQKKGAIDDFIKEFLENE